MFDALILQPGGDAVASPPIVYQLTQAGTVGNQRPAKGRFLICQAMPFNSQDKDFNPNSVMYRFEPALEASQIGLFNSPVPFALDGSERETLLVAPKHGKLDRPGIDPKHPTWWRYTPNPGFVGTDRVEFIVNGKEVQDTKWDDAHNAAMQAGIEIKLVYQLRVTREKYKDYLPQPGKLTAREIFCPKYVTPLKFINYEELSELGTILVDYSENLKYITYPETPKGQSGWWRISLNAIEPNTSDMVRAAQTNNSDAGHLIIFSACNRLEKGKGDLSPLTLLKYYFHRIKQPRQKYLTDAVVTVTKFPVLGKLVSNISPNGEMQFDYIANDPARKLGRDNVEFEVKYQGKIYKIINRIEMVENLDLYSGDNSCLPVLHRIAPGLAV